VAPRDGARKATTSEVAEGAKVGFSAGSANRQWKMTFQYPAATGPPKRSLTWDRDKVNVLGV
jgi:hypothetical protein